SHRNRYPTRQHDQPRHDRSQHSQNEHHSHSSRRSPTIDQPQHPRLDGDRSNSSLVPTTQEIRCYNCNRMGHYSRNCPIPRRTTFAPTKTATTTSIAAPTVATGPNAIPLSTRSQPLTTQATARVGMIRDDSYDPDIGALFEIASTSTEDPQHTTLQVATIGL